jgi:hypothetical protein
MSGDDMESKRIRDITTWDIIPIARVCQAMLRAWHSRMIHGKSKVTVDAIPAAGGGVPACYPPLPCPNTPGQGILYPSTPGPLPNQHTLNTSTPALPMCCQSLSLGRRSVPQAIIHGQIDRPQPKKKNRW